MEAHDTQPALQVTNRTGGERLGEGQKMHAVQREKNTKAHSLPSRQAARPLGGDERVLQELLAGGEGHALRHEALHGVGGRLEALRLEVALHDGVEVHAALLVQQRHHEVALDAGRALRGAGRGVRTGEAGARGTKRGLVTVFLSRLWGVRHWFLRDPLTSQSPKGEERVIPPWGDGGCRQEKFLLQEKSKWPVMI